MSCENSAHCIFHYPTKGPRPDDPTETVIGQVGERLSEVAEQAGEKWNQVQQGVKDIAGQAGEMVDEMVDEAGEMVEHNTDTKMPKGWLYLILFVVGCIALGKRLAMFGRIN